MQDEKIEKRGTESATFRLDAEMLAALKMKLRKERSVLIPLSIKLSKGLSIGICTHRKQV